MRARRRALRQRNTRHIHVDKATHTHPRAHTHLKFPFLTFRISLHFHSRRTAGLLRLAPHLQSTNRPGPERRTRPQCAAARQPGGGAAPSATGDSDDRRFSQSFPKVLHPSSGRGPLGSGAHCPSMSVRSHKPHLGESFACAISFRRSWPAHGAEQRATGICST